MQISTEGGQRWPGKIQAETPTDLGKVFFGTIRTEVEKLAPSEQEIAQARRLIESDLKTLRRSLERDLWDQRIQTGSEIEYVMVDKQGRPVPKGLELIGRDPELQIELSKFNVEDTTKPKLIGPQLLADLYRDLVASQRRVVALASGDEMPLLSGVLPSYRQSDFSDDNFASERYLRLNAALTRDKAFEPFKIDLRRQDHLLVEHHSILIEALNTSFQLHLSAPVKDIVEVYNVIQLLTAPVVAAAANSSVIFGKKVWGESRIPVWQQATDPERVPFGKKWVESPLELFGDLLSHRPLLINKDRVERVDAIVQQPDKKVPDLQLQNGTVWRWNRICYGRSADVPHLRVEARAIPAGPTISDMVANAAFFYGTAVGFINRLRRTYGHAKIEKLMDFDLAKQNFYAAAKNDLGAHFQWFGKTLPAVDVIKSLLPVADEGLKTIGVPKADRELYLGIIAGRLANGQNGANWLRKASDTMSGEEMVQVVRAAQLAELNEGRRSPVHEWTVEKSGQ